MVAIEGQRIPFRRHAGQFAERPLAGQSARVAALVQKRIHWPLEDSMIGFMALELGFMALEENRHRDVLMSCFTVTSNSLRKGFPDYSHHFPDRTADSGSVAPRPDSLRRPADDPESPRQIRAAQIRARRDSPRGGHGVDVGAGGSRLNAGARRRSAGTEDLPWSPGEPALPRPPVPPPRGDSGIAQKILVGPADLGVGLALVV